MSKSGYDHSTFSSTRSAAKAAGTPTFGHTAAVKAGRAHGPHPSLDPKLPNKAGELIRECLDTDGQPPSKAVAVLFDETGSMQAVPEIFVEKFPTLMKTLLDKGFLENPHILFGAIGDANFFEKAPLQLGQFEKGNEMDEALTNIYLEGKGGGGEPPRESYELAFYYMARHTRLDCFNKRGEKGYLFITGDENPYPTVRRSQIAAHINPDHGLEADIPLEDIVEELKDKFEVFWIFPGHTSHYNDTATRDNLTRLFGENFLLLPDPEHIVELIAMTIGVAEGHDVHDAGAAVSAAGGTAAGVASATTALGSYKGSSSALMKKNAAELTGELSTVGDASERL